MSKGLEALERLMTDYYEMCQDLGNNDDQYQRCNLTSERAIIEKELRAWQAVKKQLIRCPMVGGFDIFILNGDAIYPEDDCYELLEELIA